jgi:hypothetical protein
MPDKEWSRRGSFSGVGTTGTSAALSGDIIDLASNGGFHNVLLIGYQSASGSASHRGLNLEVGTASGSLSEATGDVPGTKTTLYLDAQNVPYRYVRGVFEAGTATVAYRSLVTIPYGARSLPTSHPASSTGVRTYSPGSGTATG